MASDGLRVFSQSFGAKDVNAMADNILSELSKLFKKTEDGIKDQINNIDFSEELRNKINSELEEALKNLGNKSFKVSVNLFKNILNSDGSEEAINKFLDDFKKKVSSLEKVKLSLGDMFEIADDKIIDDLEKKVEQIEKVTQKISGSKKETTKNKYSEELRGLQTEYDNLVKSIVKTDQVVSDIGSNSELDKIETEIKSTEEALKNARQEAEKYGASLDKLKEKVDKTYGKSTKTYEDKDIKAFGKSVQDYFKAGGNQKDLNSDVIEWYNSNAKDFKFPSIDELSKEAIEAQQRIKDLGKELEKLNIKKNHILKNSNKNSNELDLDKFKNANGNNTLQDDQNVTTVSGEVVLNPKLSENFKSDTDKLLSEVKIEKEVELKTTGLNDSNQNIDDIKEQIESAAKNADLSSSYNSNQFDELLSKDFTTKGKKEATDQLREAYNEFKQYYNDLNKLNTVEGQKAAYNYYKSYEEAVRKRISESNFNKYNLDEIMDFYYQSDSDDSKMNFSSLNETIDISEKTLKLFSKVQNELGNIKIDNGIAETVSKLVSNLNELEKAKSDLDNNVHRLESIDEVDGKLKETYSIEATKEAYEEYLNIVDNFKASLKANISYAKEFGETFTQSIQNAKSVITEVNNELDKTQQLQQQEQIPLIKDQPEKQEKKDEKSDKIQASVDLTPNIDSNEFKRKADNLLGDIKLEKEVELNPAINKGEKKEEQNYSSDNDSEIEKIDIRPNLDEDLWLTEINNVIDAIRTKINPIKVGIDVDTTNFNIESISDEDIKTLTTAINEKIKAIYNEEQQMRQSAGKEVASVKSITKAVQELSDLISKVPALNINAEELQKVLSNSSSYEALMNDQGNSKVALSSPVETLSDEWEKALKMAQHYNAELSNIANVTKQVRTNSKGKRLISYKVTDDKGTSVTVGKDGKLITNNEKISTASTDAKVQEKELQKYQLEIQNQAYEKLKNTIEEYGDLRQQVANKAGIATDEEIRQLDELEKKINSISNDINNQGLFDSKKDETITKDLINYDDKALKNQKNAVEKTAKAQVDAYKEIRTMQAKLVQLDPNKNTNEYSALQDNIKVKQQEIAENQKILNQNKQIYYQGELIYNQEKQRAQLLEVRRKTEVKLGQSQDAVNGKSAKEQNKLTPNKHLQKTIDIYDQYLSVVKQLQDIEIDEPNRLNDKNDVEAVALLNRKVALENEYQEELGATYNRSNEILDVYKSMDDLLKKTSNNDLKDISLDEKPQSGKIDSIDVSYDEASKINSELNKSIVLFKEIQLQKQGLGADHIFESAEKSLDKYNESLSLGKITLSDYKKEVNKLTSNLSNIVAVTNSIDTREVQETIRNKISSLYKNVDYNENDIKWTLPDKNGNFSGTLDIVDKLNKQVIQLKVNFNAADQAIRIFGTRPKEYSSNWTKFLNDLNNKFRNLGTYLLSFVGFYEVWDAIRQGVTYVRDLDSALTEMRKVSDETVGSLKEFQKESFNIADSVASTATEIQNSTADWMRLGYAIEDASELARTTAVYKAVGDDIDIATATESMVSTLQGFQLEANQAANIVDQFNEVSNNFAIDSKGIGDALQRSAASFNAANTGMSEAIALITATNAVLQDPDKVGV